MKQHLEFVESKAQNLLREALQRARTPKSGNLKKWFTEHQNDAILTYQWEYDLENPQSVRYYWQPGSRKVSRLRASYVELNGSRSDFAGVKTIYADSEYYVGHDNRRVVVYRACKSNKLTQ